MLPAMSEIPANMSGLGNQLLLVEICCLMLVTFFLLEIQALHKHFRVSQQYFVIRT